MHHYRYYAEVTLEHANNIVVILPVVNTSQFYSVLFSMRYTVSVLLFQCVVQCIQ